MENLLRLPFNPKPPTIMHLDLNSCFATIEQQANPLWRDKPLAVAAYTTANGCIIAPSMEAKKRGVKVGMRVRDGKLLCPGLIVTGPDPNKYRMVHQKLRKLLEEYTYKLTPKSIDEFVLDLEGMPTQKLGIAETAKEIKARIKAEIGEWLRISAGMAPNRFLAKVAAGLKKPDGLETIDINNFAQIYEKLQLTDLWGVKLGMTARLNRCGIYTVPDFYRADAKLLQTAFHSISGYYWYLRLRGWEADGEEWGRKSYGNSYALPKTLATPAELAPILSKLVEKMSFRMRRAGYRARGVHVGVLYRDWSHWHHGEVQAEPVWDSRDIYRAALSILARSPYRKPVHTLSVSGFDLLKNLYSQLSLLADGDKKERWMEAVDSVNEKWGNFVLTPARMLDTSDYVPDRVAFGGIKELEEMILS